MRETVLLCQQAVEAYDKLKLEGIVGIVGEVAANEKKRDLMERTRGMQAQESTLASLQSLIEQSKHKTEAIRSSYRSQ